MNVVYWSHHAEQGVLVGPFGSVEQLGGLLPGHPTD